jgi:sugar/nucleoside kinase (ribokinase family)
VADFDLLVLGDANPDLVLRGGDVVPAFGQAERMVEEATLTVGGSGAILACGAARLGLRVAICGVVGDDLFGRYLREELALHGVNTRGLITDPRRPSGLTVVLSVPGDRAMLTAPGTVADLRAELIDPALLASARHVHVSSYFLQRALQPHLPALFDAVHASGGSTSLDPNWDPDGAWDGGLNELLPRVDVFLPNAMEAMSMARISNLDDAVGRLRAMASMVVVKNGPDGAVASTTGETAVAHGIPGRVVDTTGAGDSFDAGFLAAWLADMPLARCLEIGNACGVLSTRTAGGTDAQPTMDEVLETLERGSAA